MAACSKPNVEEPVPERSSSSSPLAHYGDAFGMQANRERLERFVNGAMSGSDGVYTNYLDTDQTAEAATGHEALSESAGLLLRYYAMTGQRGPFDEEWARAKRTFDAAFGFSYRYSPKLDKRYPVNAAVDDLRLIRALREAGTAFGDARYLAEARKAGERFVAHNVANGTLRDFYDDSAHAANDAVTLCYVDLETLKSLPMEETQLRKLTGTMESIVAGGYLSDRFPFYKKSYSYATGEYSSGDIDTVESLLTILSLAEVGSEQPASIRYLKEQVKQGALYGKYAEDGRAASDVQSTAIYALAAMIGATIDDRELYEESLLRMNRYAVADEASPLFGGFGDERTLEAYSFDNLMALVAYAY